MDRYTDEDGVDGPFDRAMRAAMREDAKAAGRAPYRRSSASDADGMTLPLGKTCGDCVHIRRCSGIFGHIPEDEV